MDAAVIVDAVRTPMGRGKPGGALSSVHPAELLATLFKALVARNDLDPGMVEDVIIGCVNQVGEQSTTPGRVGWLAAGFPQHVPATTIDRKCGSSQQAIHFAAQGVMAGVYDIVVAGGVESMSQMPLGSALLGRDGYGPAFARRYTPGLVPQGIAAELVAAKWGFGRGELDEYAAASHRRAARARQDGHFAREIIPVEVTGSSGPACVREDETIRENTTPDALAALKPSFAGPAFGERFPDVEWKITAGNASQITDGAAAVVIMSERKAAALNLAPRARLAAFDVIGDDPLMMLTAPLPGTRRILKKSGLRLGDIAHYEVNEAFAPVPLAWAREFDADPERLNPCGGAIALGHPLGASGARLMTTMINALERTGGRYGLQTMCEAGGMANATIIERL